MRCAVEVFRPSPSAISAILAPFSPTSPSSLITATVRSRSCVPVACSMPRWLFTDYPPVHHAWQHGYPVAASDTSIAGGRGGRAALIRRGEGREEGPDIAGIQRG